MQCKQIWNPIKFDQRWNHVNTEKFDNIYPSWERKRKELFNEPEQYKRFIDQLKRKQAIDTGIIERMYDLKRGVTETFIKEGFVDAYLQHGDTDIAPNLLMDLLRDNYNAIDFIFDFVKSNRALSVSYIKELHQLITQHQEATEAIDPMGNYKKIPLLKGAFKNNPNNPMRDGIVYSYAPPEQVESEMDSLVDIFNSELENTHVLVKSAFLHHAFVQIHPFQDGNGRIARLLTSFVLIKGGLFPFSIDRDDRSKYIDSLEYADKGEYQPLVDIIAANQISSIERSLNWEMITSAVEFDNVLQMFEKKLLSRQNAATERRQRIHENMVRIFKAMQEKMEGYEKDLTQRFAGTFIHLESGSPDGDAAHYFTKQIVDYAKAAQNSYYANLSLDRCWVGLRIHIDDSRVYRLVISLHHYGYDDSALAIGAFIQKIPKSGEEQHRDDDRIDIPLAIPPLVMSSEKEVADLASQINQQIELSVMTALAYIANELG